MKNVINCGVDLDGVCCNFTKKFSEVCNELYGKKCYIIDDIDVIKHWDYTLWYPINKSEIEHAWEKIKNTKNFWTTLEVLNIGQWEYFIDKMNRIPNVNVYFITTRSDTEGMSVAKQSAEWLSEKGWKHPFVIQTSEKEKFVENLNIEYFIDDKDKNLIKIKNHNSDCKVYAQDAPHNKKMLDSSGIEYKRVSGLRKFADDILGELYARDYKNTWK